MPDPVNTETTEVNPQETHALSTQAPNAESREQVYKQLYGNQDPPAAPTTTQPQPPAQPDINAILTQLVAKMQGLEAQLAEARNTSPATANTSVVPPQEDWFALLQSGKRTEAETALKNLVTRGASEQIIKETVAQALELSRTEREIEDFNNLMRAQNPDLLDVEELIGLKAQQKFMPIMASIKDPKAYTDTYKRVVTEATAEIRQLMQRTRAAAKNEAMTTRREVLASTTLSPNDIQRREYTDGQQQPPAEPDTSPTNYLEMRREGYRKIAGL